jgi:tetratricopeptide (TPR) repeat protein
MTGFPANAVNALQSGNPALAERLCRGRLARSPRDAAARALLPVALARQSRHAEALPFFAALAREQPAEAAHRVNLGLAQLALGQVDDAIQTFERALGRFPAEAALGVGLGQAYLQRGWMLRAIDTLQTVLKAAPHDAYAAALLARALVEAGDQQAAAGQLATQLLAAEIPDGATLTELALALIGLQRDSDAEACLSRAIAIEPADDNARLHLAQLQERQNRAGDAAATLAAVGSQRRGDPLWLIVRARLHRRARELTAADELLTRIGKDAPVPVRAEAATEHGKVLHDLGRHEDAYNRFNEANVLTHALEAANFGTVDDDQGPDWMLRTYAPDEVAAWSPGPAPAPRTPVFVVGFPRSGTTLLENMLDAHPGLQALEERPAVDAMLATLQASGIPLDRALARMDDTTAAAARDSYWTAVGRYLTLRDDARLVDRYPLNMARLAVISRVFPGAPFVLAVRHPCDVVLSCFMQNFHVRDRTPGFHTLLNGAQVYDRLMRKWVAEVAAFQPRLHVIRYEDLVADVSGHARQLADFLGLDGEAALLDFAAHALRRGRIHTPSYAQVVQPIYRSAVMRWKSYAGHFGPALALLTPWIRHWGYEE